MSIKTNPQKCVIIVLAFIVSTGTNANADYVFGTPTNLGPTFNSSALDAGPIILAEGLELYFSSWRSGGYGQEDIWIMTRPTTVDEWGQPVNLGPTVNTSAWDGIPSISSDGLSMYFGSDRPGGYGDIDLYMMTRATTDDPWGTPVNLGPTVNSSSADWGESISPDGCTLYFASNRPGGYGDYDLWVTRRATTEDDWGTPVNLGPTVNSSSAEHSASISADGLLLFFGDMFTPRPGGYGGYDIWVTTRTTKNDDWSEPVNLGPPVNSSGWDGPVCISTDGSTLSFTSERSGGYGGLDMWQVPVIPIVDLNGDGIVDSVDMSIMVDHWGENYSLCDIGPTPLGDGIVDVQDLIVLPEYFFEQLNDPTLIAHWALDETEGLVVVDSAGDSNGYALGDPVWQPDGGLVDGAIQLDGVDDYVITGATPNLADGLFSILAWIKGGLPGQVVIAQQFSANCLLADPTEGNLMTELTSPGRSGKPLQSYTNITDDEWHRIGLTWDGSYRTLYVDSIAVAQDEQDGLEGTYGGLHIGAGKAMEPGTFWSGLIDDVRIYNRVVRP